MGASPSLPNYKQGTKPVLDAILTYMMNDLSIRDFIELSSEEKCKKYILFMANNMHTQFYEMKLFPYTNPQGVLMFRKYEDIINPSTEKESNDRKSLCLVLSYFYTRIFQIYGAMALTLIDDAKFMEKSGILGSKPTTLQYTTSLGRPPPGHPGFNPLSKMKGGDRGYFEILGSYVDSSSSFFGSGGYNVKYGGTDATITLIIKNKDSTGKYQNGSFIIKYKGNNRSYTFDVVMIKGTNDSDPWTMQYKRVIQYTENGKQKEIQLMIDSSTITFDKKPNLFDDPTIGGEKIKTYFDKLFKKIIETIKESDPTTSTGTGTGTGAIPSSSIVGLDINKIYQNLAQHRPQGHCIARAMQLLDAQTENKKISHICKIKFVDGSRSGLPEKGQSLSTSPGLSALSLLFYDVITIGTPQLNIGATDIYLGRGTSLDQYIHFMKTMAMRFTKDTGSSISDMSKISLDKILNERDKVVCDASKINDSDVLVSDAIQSTVEKIVNKLLTQQMEHAAKCMVILDKLFQITKDAAGNVQHISLSPALINGGFTFLNQINYQTRQLLIEYYSNCEKTYIDGMETIVKDKMGSATATTATTTTTTTIAPLQHINIIKQLQKNAGQNVSRRNQTVRGGSKRKR
jgi:hypothetical protein